MSTPHTSPAPYFPVIEHPTAAAVKYVHLPITLGYQLGRNYFKGNGTTTTILAKAEISGFGIFFSPRAEPSRFFIIIFIVILVLQMEEFYNEVRFALACSTEMLLRSTQIQKKCVLSTLRENKNLHWRTGLKLF